MRRYKPSFKPYRAPAGGWGSANSLQQILLREGVVLSGPLALSRQNKVTGFQCVSCAWNKPANPLPFEFCENGAKATAWEITTHRATPEMFRAHSVSELRGWTDFALEQSGRLTHPLRYDQASDRYLPVRWDEAFAEIGRELGAVADRRQTVFYSSGRCSNEASYMYGLLARLYGNNNLPDSSNMCHETTSVALPLSIGVPVGTVTLDDFAATECIMFFGQNPGVNSPRMLHPLQAASKRGVPIIVFNPLRERGLERFTNPQSPSEMLTGEETRIASSYQQVKIGGDLAALTGICKALIDLDDAACGAVLDHDFIVQHTHGFETFTTWLRRQDWDELVRRSGLAREAMQATAATYARASSAMAIYGMGITQHRAGVETVRMICNLLLLRGNIGRPGAGICPVRGHSNVQGQRTVGITEKVKLLPIERLREQFGFEPPLEDGLNTVEACEKILAGDIKAFVMLGGNFLRAIPDRDRMEAAWPRMRLTVNIITKPNRSMLFPGAVSYVLPVLGRIEQVITSRGPQALSIEDSTACIHGSLGVRTGSKHLLSEPKVVAEIAKATLRPNPRVPWDVWAEDFAEIRRAISHTYPDIFHDYERRMWEPGGFHRDLPARKRIWHTDSGLADFVTPRALEEDMDQPEGDSGALRMMTTRSNDQFNTTVYGYHDRFRGIRGTRMVVLMNRDDIDRLNLQDGQSVRIEAVASDGLRREMAGFRVTEYDIPAGCCATYFPEANALLPLGHYAEGSMTPAAKSIPVHVHAEAKAQAEPGVPARELADAAR